MSEPLYDMVAVIEERAKNLDKNLDLFYSYIADLAKSWRVQLHEATLKGPGSVDWPLINKVLSSMEEFELAMKKEALKH